MAFWELILALLAAVGLTTILWEMWRVLSSPGPEERETYILLPASGSGEDLEQRVRRHYTLPKQPTILILDMGLDEEGQLTAHLLTQRYFAVQILTPEELLSFIE